MLCKTAFQTIYLDVYFLNHPAMSSSSLPDSCDTILLNSHGTTTWLPFSTGLPSETISVFLHHISSFHLFLAMESLEMALLPPRIGKSPNSAILFDSGEGLSPSIPSLLQNL
ncbi:hypothetical protein HPP92_028161 [Vanilla planifolia]|uniref:Uncharacterized protein n=1 Tax=Vanilla planifolia TaxID=51239 RepID=A0A835P9Q9_VANPL|nr:hypothetical protein HPP92_028161 [Vanilla planifolia]